jgi:splicing factor 3A subunit 1
LLQGTEDKQNKSLKDVKAPENDKFVVEPPRNLSQLDVDVIKHTAQFVAKNGRKFLVALTEREKLNP